MSRRMVPSLVAGIALGGGSLAVIGVALGAEADSPVWAEVRLTSTGSELSQCSYGLPCTTG